MTLTIGRFLNSIFTHLRVFCTRIISEERMTFFNLRHLTISRNPNEIKVIICHGLLPFTILLRSRNNIGLQLLNSLQGLRALNCINTSIVETRIRLQRVPRTPNTRRSKRRRNMISRRPLYLFQGRSQRLRQLSPSRSNRCRRSSILSRYLRVNRRCNVARTSTVLC